MTLLIFFYLMGGLLFLYLGAELLIKGASRMAFRLGVPVLVIGLTIVSMGTSLPELVASLVAQIDVGEGDIALGNAIGSNIANVGLILGITALVRPLSFSSHVSRIDMPLMIGAQILLLILMIPLTLFRLSGLLMVSLMLIYVIYRIKTGEPSEEEEELSELLQKSSKGFKEYLFDVFLILLGLIALAAGGKYFVDGAVQLATYFQIPERVIGLTVVALGTSLPELATTLVAALKKHSEIAIGNVVGSNIFNSLLIAGGVSLLLPIHFSKTLLTHDGPIMLLFCFLLWGIVWRNNTVSRLSGAFLLLCYALFVLNTVL